MIDRDEARDLLHQYHGNTIRDYHTLSSSQVDALLADADRYKYRKPKNANGSRARYFHEYLRRRAEGSDE